MSARITLVLELTGIGGVWGPECTVGQVRDQATKAALSLLRAQLAPKADIRIIGEPKISMLLVSEAIEKE